MLKIALTGGCGFVGQRLAAKLHELGWIILLLDISDCPGSLLNEKTLFAKISMCDSKNLEKELKNFAPHVVIHLASWGMSGSAMLSKDCEKINLLGTENLLRICQQNSIHRIIYTSSYNVIFGGKCIENGDESWSYFPIDKHTDQYSRSKALAESMVLKLNGQKAADSGLMFTASIRPAAIYGEGEQRHLPRILRHIDGGLFTFKIGNATVDWVHVDNLVNSFVLLLDKMMKLEDASVSPAGRAYFISDGSPINNFEFFRPLCAARGKQFPSITVPVQAMVVLGFLLETVYHVSSSLGCPLEPLLTRAEVFKVGVTHYVSISKARRELGYSPMLNSQQGAERLAQHYFNVSDNRDYFTFAAAVWYLLILSGMGLLFAVAFTSEERLLQHPMLYPVYWLGLLIFRSQPALRVVFYLAVLAHVGEAGYCAYLTRKHGFTNTWMAWTLQTLVLGFPSLELILARIQVSK